MIGFLAVVVNICGVHFDFGFGKVQFVGYLMDLSI
jgi:hypothetical protein